VSVLWLEPLGAQCHSQSRCIRSFNDGFKFQWRNGDITDPTTGQKCIVMEGKPIGTPSAINVTTLVYAYTWK
jgi:hypothetical protein